MNLLKHINSCNLFIGLYCMYLAMSANESSSITGYLLLLITIISLCYFLYVVMSQRQPQMLKWFSVLIFVFFLYGAFYLIDGETIIDHISGGPVRKVDYIKKIAASLLPVYAFYVFTQKGQLTTRTILFWTPIIVLLSTYAFFQYHSMRLAWAHRHGSGQIEFTNNAGYIFVSILPLVFIKQKAVLQYIMIAFIAVFAVMSAKRGAILIAGLSICYYLYSTLSGAKTSQKLKYIFLAIAGVIIAGYYISDYIQTSAYFSERLQATMEGNTSGRDEIYTILWRTFVDSNIPNQIFGHGPDRTIVYSHGFLAHNDWLEILTNQGLFGVIIYLILFQKLFKTWRRYRNDQIIGISLGGLFIVLFLRTFFSMSYTEYTLATCMALGYCMRKVAEIEHAKTYGKRIAR